MPRQSAKLKVVDIKNETSIETPIEETPVEERVSGANPLNSKGVEPVETPVEIQPVEPVIMKKPRAKAKTKAKKVETPVEPPVETPPPVVETPPPVVEATGLTGVPVEVKPKVKKTRVKKEVEQPKIIEKYVEKQIPHIIERIVEKEPRIIKQDPDYNNIPEEIILREIKKREQSAKEERMNKKLENTRRLVMNIA